MRLALLLAPLALAACTNAAGQHPRQALQQQLDMNARKSAGIAAQLGESLGVEASCGLPPAVVAEKRTYFAQVSAGDEFGINRQMILLALNDAYTAAAAQKRDPRSMECQNALPPAYRARR